MDSALISEQNSKGFLRRFIIYQHERFPFLAHGVMISAFSFSAVSYSRICRGAAGFIDLKTFLGGVFTTVTLFYLLRVFDEFKDAEDDARYRRNLPVPRGLISLGELRTTGIVAFVLQVLVNAWLFPKMLILYAIVIAYLLLMGKEFFVAGWLRRHQVAYVISHMLIIPLVDTYASGLDWLLAGVAAPAGLLFFFGVSYCNGVVLEIGRKIRQPGMEEEGVITYSAMYGPVKAAVIWIIMLLATFGLSAAASYYAGYGALAYIALTVLFVVCTIPTVLFITRKTKQLSKMIEYASALWTVCMYLLLGGIPMLEKLITHS